MYHLNGRSADLNYCPPLAGDEGEAWEGWEDSAHSQKSGEQGTGP